jgi:hypothetical protein
MASELEESDASYAKNLDGSDSSLGWNVVNLGWLRQPPELLAAIVFIIAFLFILATLVMVGFGLFASFRFAYESLFGDFKDRVEVAKVFFPVLVALIGGPLLIWRVITAHWAAQAARHQAQTAREAHYTDLFTKAIEQLGATREVKINEEVAGPDGAESKREVGSRTEPNLEMRLGAIYALERIARDSEKDRRPILNVICAYTRSLQNSGAPKKLPDNWYAIRNATDEWARSIPALRPDVQVAVEFLGRASQITGDDKILRKVRLKLSGANLQRADLRGLCYHYSWMFKVNLAFAILLDTDFEFVELSQSYLREADLAGGRLRGAALFGADLSGARNLKFEQISESLGDSSTRLPDGLSHPKHWPARALSWSERRDWYIKVRFEQLDPATAPIFLPNYRR